MFNLGTLYRVFRNTLFEFVFQREIFSYPELEQIYLKNRRREVLVQILPQGFTYCLSYSHPYVRKAVWSFKFRNNKTLAQYFARILFHEISYIFCINTSVRPLNNVLVTVPSSKESNRGRGFDSNHEIAKYVSKLAGVTYIPNVFIKRSGVSKQSRTTSKQERLTNPIDAFILKKPDAITNKNIILFDDVLTTGATMREIVKLLESAGAPNVQIIVLAH